MASKVRELLTELAESRPMSEAELRFRIEPLKAEREAAVRALLEVLDDPAFRGLAVVALHELAAASDADLLVGAFRDPLRSDRARAEIAQVLTGVAAERLENLLEPRELQDLSLLSIETLLDRLGDRAGMTQVIELYRGSSRNERRALLDAIATTTAEPRSRVRLGAALDPLFPHESDDGLRLLMIRWVAGRREPASARALSRWLKHSHGTARRRCLEALRRMNHVGIRPGLRRLQAWVSGVDATGSFNVGISFPGPLELRDIVLASISVDTGLRAMNLLSAVAPDTTDEIARALEEGQAIPVAPIDVPTALRHIESAQVRTVALGRTLPEGFRAAAAYLNRPLAIAAPPLRTPSPASLSRAQLATLIDAPPYATWAFGAAELRLPSLFSAAEAPSSQRLRAAARATLRGLEGSPAAERLVAMLRHQSEVHRLRRETALAARSLAVADEIAAGGLGASAFARRMIERSVVATLVHGPRAPRAEVREAFKRRIEETSPLRRRAVAVLDVAEALYRQLENRGERSLPARRLTLAQMEGAALAAAEICVRELVRDSIEQPRLPGMEAPETAAPAVVRRRIRADSTRVALEAALATELERTIGAEDVKEVAAALAGTARWFAAEVCLRRCRRGCLGDPESDGRALFFQRGHPAGFDSFAPEGTAGRSPAAVALRQQLMRRLEDEISLADEFRQAVETLGLPPRGEGRSRVRRAGELRDRLLSLLAEVERTEEDPAWLYTLVEETDEVVRELRTLYRHLLGAVLGRLQSNAEQFAAFRPYPGAAVAWRRAERQIRALGLIGLRLESLHAAINRFDSDLPLTALLRAAVDRPSAAALNRLAAATKELWRHTPRTALGGRTPAQAEPGARADDQPRT